jgi:hypothetical protein
MGVFSNFGNSPGRFSIFVVLATGPRDCRRSETISRVVYHLYMLLGRRLEFVQGGAPGLDTYVDEACRAFGIPSHTEPADWPNCDVEGGWCKPGHRRWRADGTEFCPAAGPRRNALMLTKWNPQLALSFLDRPLKSTKGTCDMVDRVRRAQCPYVEVDLHKPLVTAINAIEVQLAKIFDS